MIFSACPAPILDHKTIVLGHGSGGKLTHQLIQKMILPAFRNPALETQHDGAVLPINGGRIAFSADSYVVNPIFFPGGNIGDLAINGTVNDLAMCGAQPQYLSASFIIEEGLAMDDFWRILCSMKDAAEAAGVSLVTGDTKVIDRGKGDKIFINTSGIGIIPEGINIDPRRAQPGDQIIVS
jgi:hydrogenase expression/formation protein HypE